MGSISDLHFCEKSVFQNKGQAHSLELLLGLEEALKPIQSIDRVIVTGDISNVGDTDSLNKANDWLLNRFSIGKGKQAGLGLNREQLGIVPGNHDAYNFKKTGPFIDRRQANLKHFNDAFHDFRFDVNGDDCRYDWVVRNGFGIFIVYMDSCYLGDQYDEHGMPFHEADKVAQGSFSISQTQTILRWVDRGLRGNLDLPRDEGEIDAGQFAHSLKILVTHHYLFEPKPGIDDHFMKLRHREIAFRNLALAGFDIMLCGHRHVWDFKPVEFGNVFDRRTQARFFANLVRRRIGLHSLPLQYEDPKGKRKKRNVVTFLQALAASFSRSNGGEHAAGSIEDRFVAMLNECIEDPRALERHLKKVEQDFLGKGERVFDQGEVEAIVHHAFGKLSKNQLKILDGVADEVRRMSRQIRKRGMVQVMSGSTVKRISRNDTSRSFNRYEITANEAMWKICSTRFTWDPEKMTFYGGFPTYQEFQRFPQTDPQEKRAKESYT